MKIFEKMNKTESLTEANIRELFAIAKEQKQLIERMTIVICQQEYVIKQLKAKRYDYI